MREKNYFFSGITELLILAILSHHDSYAYEITKFIKETSNGTLDISQNTIYAITYKMEEEGKISQYWYARIPVKIRRKIPQKIRQRTYKRKYFINRFKNLLHNTSLVCFYRPTHFGTLRSWIFCTLLCRRTNYIFTYFTVYTLFFQLFKRTFYQSVLS